MPAIDNSEPLARVNLRCAPGDASKVRADAAKYAYNVELMMAMATNVQASTSNWKRGLVVNPYCPGENHAL